MNDPTQGNPYTSQYMPNGFSQDAQGMMPVFQNIAQQQANLTQNLSQENQLAQQAGQTTPQASPMALAALLRKKDPNDPSQMMGAGVPLPNPNVNPYGNMSSYNNNTMAGSGGNYGSGTGGFE